MNFFYYCLRYYVKLWSDFSTCNKLFRCRFLETLRFSLYFLCRNKIFTFSCSIIMLCCTILVNIIIIDACFNTRTNFIVININLDFNCGILFLDVAFFSWNPLVFKSSSTLKVQSDLKSYFYKKTLLFLILSSLIFILSINYILENKGTCFSFNEDKRWIILKSIPQGWFHHLPNPLSENVINLSLNWINFFNCNWKSVSLSHSNVFIV